ncbi:MAG: DUF2723 domain-containing protein, partial [Chloroflexi bacterium]|nr:DUF2723 domain-containing protein [Chloroflexota bacterium]
MKQHALSNSSYAQRFQFIGVQFTFFFLLFIGALAATRILYELFFPQLLWLGRPLTALLAALFITFIIWSVWFFQSKVTPVNAVIPVVLIPLALNLIYLMELVVDPVRSRLIFGASVWLVLLFALQGRLLGKYGRLLNFVLILAALLPTYLLTMSSLVGRDDVFEFQVVTPQLGIVHPTGYPLYLMLGKLFTLLPISTSAWRLNFASVVYAVVGLGVLALLMWGAWKRPFIGIITAVVIGLSPTFWSQAIIAEVYTLHFLIVSLVLWLLIVGYVQNQPTLPFLRHRQHILIAIAALLGLGLTNHLTTLILIPAVGVSVWSCKLLTVSREPNHSNLHSPLSQSRFLITVLISFLLPLILYAYLPLRWQVIVGGPMGFGRFVDWVVGGRFQGALQLMAWLRDPTRYAVVGRLFLDNWGWFNLLLAVVGVVYLAVRQWRTALILFLVWSGYAFYCLNYYVPDLAVFLLPAQVVIGLSWGAGVWAIFDFGRVRLPQHTFPSYQAFVLLLLCI